MSISCSIKAFGIDLEVAELVRSNIESSLRNFSISSEVLLKNNNMCISVSDEDIELWVRLLPTRDNKVSVDFSTVQLSDRLQNKGIFTSIFSNVKSLEEVGVLKISSVYTRCMTKWCIKNGLKSEDGFDYFA